MVLPGGTLGGTPPSLPGKPAVCTGFAVRGDENPLVRLVDNRGAVQPKCPSLLNWVPVV